MEDILLPLYHLCCSAFSQWTPVQTGEGRIHVQSQRRLSGLLLFASKAQLIYIQPNLHGQDIRFRVQRQSDELVWNCMIGLMFR